MSKIRMAILGECSYIAIAWISKTGHGQVLKVNIPNRKKETIKRILKEGLDFPEKVKKPPVQASQLILPPGVVLQKEAERIGKSPIAEY